MNTVPDHNDFIRAACRMSFKAFVMKAFEVLHPGQAGQFIDNWHVEAMCYRLQRVHAGAISRLALEVPPRHLKSITASVAFPAWLIGLNPSTKILVASYGGELADRHARDMRTLMNSDFYRSLFPRTEIDVDRNGEITTTAGGVRKAISVGGAATGFGADYIIVDDIMKASDVGTEMEERAKEFYTSTLIPRLNDQRTGKIIILQQRLSESDVVAHARATGDFVILSLPSIAQQSESIPIYGGTVRRTTGDLLFPERDTAEVLERLRREMGNSAFSAQYLQNPTPPGGNRLRWEWFGTYAFEVRRPMFQRVVQSWDTGQSEDPRSSFSVCITAGWREGHWHIFEVQRGKWAYRELKAKAFALIAKWDPDRVLIEKAASGHALLDDLRLNVELRGIVRKVTVKLDKETRFEAAAARVEEGRFKIPESAQWLDEFRRELLAFPRSARNDQVDAFSQLAEWEKMAGDHSNYGRGKRPSISRRRTLHPTRPAY